MDKDKNQQGDEKVWYAGGLKFQCIFPKCNRCCCGEPGYVWLADGEAENVRARTTDEITRALVAICSNKRTQRLR